MRRRLTIGLLILAAMVMLGGCNTIDGVRRDVHYMTAPLDD